MTEGKFKTVITSKRKAFDLHIRETLKYRDLIFLFVKRDFISQYKQTVLGPLWAIIQPLLTTVVFTLIFGMIANLKVSDVAGGDIPQFLFFMSGTVCWSYFSATLSATSSTFINNRATMGKVYYPRLVAPLSTVFSKLISFGIQFGMLIIIWAAVMIRGGTIISVSLNLLFIPLVIAQMMALSLGCGIIISSVTTKYRDLAMLVGFGLQLWQYASPVAYGLTQISGSAAGEYLWLYMLNPFTPIVTTFRYALFGVGYFDLTFYLISWAVTLFVLFIGLMLFSRIERNFTDTV